MFAEIIEYIRCGMIAEAIWLLEDEVTDNSPSITGAQIRDIESAVSKLPPDIRPKLSSLLDILKTRIDKQSSAARESFHCIAPPASIESDLACVKATLSRPDRIAEAYEKMRLILDGNSPEAISRHSPAIIAVISMFMPSRRNKLTKLLDLVLAQPAVEGDENVIEDFSLDVIFDEVRGLILSSNGNPVAAYELLCDMINAFDGPTVTQIMSKLKSLHKMFPARYSERIARLIEKRTGYAIEDDLQPSVPRGRPSLHTPIPTAVNAIDDSLNSTGKTISPEQTDSSRVSESSSETSRISKKRLPSNPPVTIAGYILTGHARERITRRGIRPSDLETIFEHGNSTFAQGAEFFYVPDKTMRSTKSIQRECKRIEGVRVVCSGGIIITAYKSKHYQKRLKTN